MSVSPIPRKTVPELPEPEERIILAERITLGAMMYRAPEIVADIISRLSAEDFLRPAHAQIFDVICDLWANDLPTDPFPVIEELGRRSSADRAHPAYGVQLVYLHECKEEAERAAGTPGYYANQVAAAGRRRRFGEELIGAAARLGAGGVDVDEVAEQVRDALAALEKGRADGAWPEPVPLAARVPEFPVSVLPAAIRQMVAGVAEATQTPPDLAAFTALSALSAASRGVFQVRVRPGWVEQTALYLVALADSGSRKTAVVRAIGAPLFDLERSRRAAGREDYLRRRAEYRLLEKQARAAEDAAAKSGTDEALETARELAVELGKQTPPTEFRLLVDDVTPEKLGQLMAEQGGPMAVLSAEGGLLGTLAGRYSDSANVDLVLKAYDAEPVRTDRIGRESVDIERPFLALGLIVQPDVIARACEVPEFVERGLLPRCLFAVPASTLGTRALDAPDVPSEAEAAWWVCVRGVFNLAVEYAERPEGERFLVVGAEARKVLDGFRAELEPRLHPDLGDLAGIAAWASKLPGALVRIAALFALARISGQVDPVKVEAGFRTELPQVTDADMRAAVALAPYLIAHARVALALDEHRRDTRQAATLAWIRRRTVPEVPQQQSGRGSGSFGTAFTARDAWRGLHGRAWAKSAADVQAVLDELAEMGWIRRRPDPPRKGGRPPSPTYDVHPKLVHGDLW